MNTKVCRQFAAYDVPGVPAIRKRRGMYNGRREKGEEVRVNYV